MRRARTHTMPGSSHLAVSVAAHASEVTDSTIAAWQAVISEELARLG